MRTPGPRRSTGPGVGAARLAAVAVAIAASAGWPGAAPSAAQVVFERDVAGVRLWSGAAGAVEVPLPASYREHAAVEAEGGHVVAGVDSTSGDLFFVHREAGSIRELPAPAGRAGGVRSWPVLLASAERLEGAVWLEGTSQQGLAIRAAAWNGTSWEDVELVSPARGRPQLAPSGAVLSDGSWLVVWAGYDGQDDEIYWSRRTDGGVWSTPSRLHRGNRVPDILPSVVAHGDGARAAWSFFDGNDYRVKVAGWDGTSWRVERVLEGLGAVDAGWQTIGERTFVIYHSVEFEGWALMELEADGSVVHASRHTGEAGERPLVTATESSRPRLVFPARGRRAPR